MPMNQSELAAEFERGAKSGMASNVSIQEASDGGTVIVGYGHAVYAYRSPSGRVTTFKGWTYNPHPIRPNAGSQSTKCQYSKMGLVSMADKVVKDKGPKGAPKMRTYLGDSIDRDIVA